MLVKVTGICETNFYNQNNQDKPQTKFYEPQTQKEEVKKDFGLLLDVEIKKLKFDVYI
jgi:hypothetical protein